MLDQPLYTNRLINEKSPYLLQHAHNPVDWYPWGEEAFKAARNLDKPIFLSIGYATCHWCHVMERESFENIEVAKLMNQAFINIKVDREELPEVDNLYMEFAQSMMSGVAGWPLNVILTFELQPFFAVTYLPPYSKPGFMGLVDLVHRMMQLWSSETRDRVVTQAEKIIELFSESVHVKGDILPESTVVLTTIELLYKMADPIYGGMKGAPKFPVGYQSSFMMRYFLNKQDSRALFLVERTLDMMHRGGIYDHLGGGFSRYSVDEAWVIPHFEKMLYDNALLAQVYLEAWQLTKADNYRFVCHNILDYIIREMTHSEGGFYSAEDADTEGCEGLFYTWTYQEIINILGPQGRVFCEFYNITREGNFEGRNIIHATSSLQEFAANYGYSLEELELRLTNDKKKLWEIREQRPHPFKDDKIVSAWNGLMIYSMVEAGNAFNNEVYLQAALKAARFIKKHLWQNGELLRRWRDGEAMFAANLDEYAYLIRGVISLFESNLGIEWLEWALEMAALLQNRYKEYEGAFYQTDGLDKNLILRRCQFSDGAEPSGNAIHTENLLRLFQITQNTDYLQQAEDVFKGVQDYLDNYSPGYCYHIMNLQRYFTKKTPTMVVVLNSNRDGEKEIRHAIYENFIPYKAIIWQTHDIELNELLPWVKKYPALQDCTTLYICYQGECLHPLNELKDILRTIKHL